MTALWTAADTTAATGGTVVGWESVSGLSIDTRELSPGDLFVALAGDNRDGHAFVGKALDAGAGAAMVTHRPEGVPVDAPLLIVEDTLAALESLGRAARARTAARVIAVTGSVGKTSTKEMLRTMLLGQGQVHAAVRSFNNHWGVPLTLARMPADTDYAVIEIGMNHAGEITPLSQMARPHVALITTVAAVHMAAFNSIGEIADAKGEIFAGLEPGGTSVINADIETFERLRAQISGQVLTFGASGEFALVDVQLADQSTAVRADCNGRPLIFKIGAPGRHFAANALGALAAAEAAGADLARAALAMATWTPPDGRGSRRGIETPDGAIILLDESYNANPASMAAALSVLAATRPEGRGRRHAFLGDMLELGPAEIEYHASLANLEDIAGIDKIHTCGPRMKALHDALPSSLRGVWVEDSAALGAAVPKLLVAGDIAMVKGSLGARMARVVDAIKALGEVGSDTGEEQV